MTDPIADLLTRIRNAQAVKAKKVNVPYSTIKEAIVKTLKAENYVIDYQVTDSTPFKTIEITLKYVSDNPAISQIKRLSKPGRRIYADHNSIPKPLSGYGTTIISSNSGVITDKQARSQKIGGELICQVW